MGKKRPDFDDIKSYEEFEQYKWNRGDLVEICRAHGLLFVGTEKKLRKVIEAYYNGEKIPPRRNWYTNPILSTFVNENGVMVSLCTVLTVIALILCTIGIMNKVRDLDDLYYVPHLVFGITLLVLSLLGFYTDKTATVLLSFHPICGDKKFTREEVDEQANAAVNIGYEGVLLAPDMVIGVTAGVCAVAYEDIASVMVKRKERFETHKNQRWRNRNYFVYDIVLKTRKGKKVVISRSEKKPDSAVKMIYKHCLTKNPQVCFLIEDQQVTHGEAIKSAVGYAVTRGFLTGTTVSEEVKKGFLRVHFLMAIDSILGSLVVSGGLILILTFFGITWLSIVGIVVLLVLLTFPFFMFMNLFTLISLTRKNDLDFYVAEICQTYDNGYSLSGLPDIRFGFIRKMRPKSGPDIGDRVILARVEDRFSLISYDLR